MTALMGMAAAAYAQQIVDGVSISQLKTERNGDYIAVGFDMNLEGLQVESNRAVLLTPRIVNGEDSVELQSVGVYGRRRYYYYVRNGESMISGENERSYRSKDKPDSVSYHVLVPYEKWMNGATLNLHRSDWGCCSSLLDEQDGWLGNYLEEFFPTLVYMRPQGEIEKQESLDGSAFVDFPVDQTIIYPEYHSNVAELGKIQATIDSVNTDRDITITQVWLKGYASPESPYSHNTMLAKGRTAALKTHIQNLYNFKEGIITTDYEPENWEGLRRYVEKSNLEHRTEILALIDADMDPDVKEKRIKTTYPDEYKFLLKNCYPALRRTDYRIAYVIRSFTDIEEIKRVMKEQPRKLSLNEFYLLSQEYEPGTEEFTEVFETAVRMYPTDENANLNAANAAMRRDDLTSAKKYLEKAGSSAEAVYARAAYAIRSEDYATARALLQQAQSMGLEQAGETLQQLNKRY